MPIITETQIKEEILSPARPQATPSPSDSSTSQRSTTGKCVFIGRRFHTILYYFYLPLNSAQYFICLFVLIVYFFLSCLKW